MTLRLDIPNAATLELRFLLLDVNGTLGDRGRLIEGVAERLDALRETLEPRLLSADTFGTVAELSGQLRVPAQRAASAPQKLAVVDELGASSCVAVGNGANDASMLEAAALGIAVIGPEGASAGALAAADVVCRSIVEALDLLAEPRVLTATLRR
jgi:P-type E1-E2 ATPase